MDEQRTRARILVVDDEEVVRRFVARVLRDSYDVIEASDGAEALRRLSEPGARPDLILLDVRMPELDGYEVCAQIQARDDLSYIPVVFVTAMDSDADQKKAFAVGGAAYIHKPVESEELLSEIRRHLDTEGRWRSLRPTGRGTRAWMLPSTFQAFKHFVEGQRNASPAETTACDAVRPTEIYKLASTLRMANEQLARYLAHFLELPYSERIQADDLGLGVLPRAFCESNLVVPLQDGTIVVSNPFDWELMHTVDRTLWRTTEPKLAIADPERIRALLEEPTEGMFGSATVGVRTISIEADRAERGEMADDPAADALKLLSDLLREAVAERASDVHVEPKEQGALVRFRIDGDMQDVRRVTSTQATRMVSRLKALAGLDIAERRKPQDGALMATLRDRRFKLRLATSSTTAGETMVIRILDPEAQARPLEDLGLTQEQASQLRELATRHQGMIFVVGPTGSGKSTTIFTLLSTVDGRARSIMSVEDPVEYRIPYANQQQVNQRAGVTFEALLKSAMRQDPDILFLGEVRDPFSARAVLEFASSGHLTISSLHSSNATTAIFRLERLGIERGAMADGIAAVVAQKLLKRLCPDCKEVSPIKPAERALLEPFTDDIPETVAHAVGCPACRGTGYRGREGAFEVLVVDRDTADLIRSGKGIAELRAFCAQRGDYLVSDHALEKLRAHVFAVRDVVDEVLLEESVSLKRGAASGQADTAPGARAPSPEKPREGAAHDSAPSASAAPAPQRTTTGEAAPAEEGRDTPPLVLVVDDDEDLRSLVHLHLTHAGYQVIMAADGADALMALAQHDVDLILSDINMPNLDGLKLMEILSQKGVEAPTLFLSATEDLDIEAKVLGYGAADYIRKPVRKEVLLLRVGNALRSRVPPSARAGLGS